MSAWPEQKPGWQTENELAKSLGFECVRDPARGGNWCRFVLGDWHVWSIVSWVPGNPPIYQRMAWQVARADGARFVDHYTRRHLKKGEYGISGPGFRELKDALEYAKGKVKA